jgi:branched-chain amino acid transport system substrate-binding protein
MDDKADSTEAANAYNSLVSQGVVAIIGSVTSGVTAGLGTLADSDGMLLLTPTATNDDVTVGLPSVFRACYADSYQSSIAAKFLAETMGVKKVAVLYASGDTYSSGMYEGFKKAAEGLGLEIVAEESTSSTSDTDFSTQLTNIAASGAEAIFAPYYYDAVGPYIVPQARAAGFTGIMVGADGWDGTVDTMVDDKSLYNNTYFTNHYAADDPAEKVQHFVNAYKDKYGSTPNALGALGYDSVYMLAQAIDKAGTDDTAAIVEAMKGETFDVVTGKFSLNENNTPSKPCAIIEFKDGAMVWKATVG